MKLLEQIEEAPLLEHPAHEHLQFQRRLRRIALAIDRAPDLEPFLIRRERADARFEPVGDHEHLVVVQQRGNLLLVGLKLVVRRSDSSRRLPRSSAR